MLTDYLSPIDEYQLFEGYTFSKNQWGNIVPRYVKDFPELEGVRLAIIGVQSEEGNPENEGTEFAPDHVRKALYKLHRSSNTPEMVDLGNIKRGASYQDTLYALKTVIGNLLYKNIIPVIIGGSHDLTYGQFLGYEELNETVNIACVDERINIKEGSESPDASGFLLEMFLHEPNFLFNYCQLGHQSYYVDPETLLALEKLHFDCYRLGVLNSNMEEVEAIIRDSDIMSFDISAIQGAYAPGHAQASPNGFNGEQACQIARYAGISDKTTSFGLYEINPLHDERGLTAQLAAQMIWYFVEGYYSRLQDKPFEDKAYFQRFTVDLEEEDHDLTFWKSTKSGRWWMEVPYSPEKQKFMKHHMVSCSYADYQSAMKGDIPDRWIRAYDKLS